MPLFLKDIKKELQADRYKKGKKKDGSYKHEPPSIVSRQLRDYTNLAVTKFDQVLRVGIKAIDFSAMVKSETTKGMKYRVTVRFLGVPYNTQLTDDTPVSGKNSEDETVYFKAPHIRLNQVMLKCSCPDFRHRFEHELNDADALIGAPRKYKRKTPIWPLGRPYANSTHKVGVCKHVHSMIHFLRSKKLLGGAL